MVYIEILQFLAVCQGHRSKKNGRELLCLGQELTEQRRSLKVGSVPLNNDKQYYWLALQLSEKLVFEPVLYQPLKYKKTSKTA